MDCHEAKASRNNAESKIQKELKASFLWILDTILESKQTKEQSQKASKKGENGKKGGSFNSFLSF